MLLTILLGCARHPAPLDGPLDGALDGPLDVAAPLDVPLDVASVLAEPVLGARHELRATVATIGPFQVTPGKRTFSPSGPIRPFDTVVIADEGDWVRVADELGGIRVVIGVRREDLALRPADRVALHSGEGGSLVEIVGGTPVSTLEQGADRALVSWSDQAVSVRGWLPASAVAPIWRSAPYKWAVGDVEVADPTGGDGPSPEVTIHDAPDGEVIATIKPSDWALRSLRSEPGEGGWRRVDVRTDTLRVVGFMRAEALVPAREFGVEGGVLGGIVPADGWLAVELAEGVGISRGGVAFARAVGEATVWARSVDGDALEVSFGTRWGTLSGTVDCTTRTKPRSAKVRCEP